MADVTMKIIIIFRVGGGKPFSGGQGLKSVNLPPSSRNWKDIVSSSTLISNV